MSEKTEYARKSESSLETAAAAGVFAAVRTSWPVYFLVCATVLLSCSAIWAFFGRITVSITGPGITLLSGGVSPVSAPSDGVIKNITVDQGAYVLANQVIGYVHNPEVVYRYGRELSKLENQLKLLRTAQPQTDEIRDGIGQIEDEMERVRRLSDESTYIRATATGTVIELMKESGSHVGSGEKVALVASGIDRGIYLVAFVPAHSGKAIRNGMRAFFSPGIAPSGRYGYIRAVVRDVSDVPINRETIQRELMNETLTGMLAGDEAMIRVVIDLIPDGDSASGYSWTGSRQFSQRITNGIYGSVIINTEYRAPVTFVLPKLRSLFE